MESELTAAVSHPQPSIDEVEALFHHKFFREAADAAASLLNAMPPFDRSHSSRSVKLRSRCAVVLAQAYFELRASDDACGVIAQAFGSVANAPPDFVLLHVRLLSALARHTQACEAVLDLIASYPSDVVPASSIAQVTAYIVKRGLLPLKRFDDAETFITQVVQALAIRSPSSTRSTKSPSTPSWAVHLSAAVSAARSGGAAPPSSSTKRTSSSSRSSIAGGLSSRSEHRSSSQRRRRSVRVVEGDVGAHRSSAGDAVANVDVHSGNTGDVGGSGSSSRAVPPSGPSGLRLMLSSLMTSISSAGTPDGDGASRGPSSVAVVVVAGALSAVLGASVLLLLRAAAYAAQPALGGLAFRSAARFASSSGGLRSVLWRLLAVVLMYIAKRNVTPAVE